MIKQFLAKIFKKNSSPTQEDNTPTEISQEIPAQVDPNQIDEDKKQGDFEALLGRSSRAKGSTNPDSTGTNNSSALTTMSNPFRDVPEIV